MKNISVALFGTLVEYFDYALYGFAAYYIALNFFPDHDPAVALVKTLLVFSLAAFAKPLGAAVFSHIGDKWGRVVSLRYSMLGIALPTSVIGLLPSYESWGAVSTSLLVLCRFLQGFLVAGEYDGVSIYVQETVPDRLACFGNSMVCASSLLGVALASIALDISSVLFSESFAWRVPFLMAGVMAVFVLLGRRSMRESKSFVSSAAVDWPEVLGNNKLQILGVMFLCGAAGAFYHFVFVFLPLAIPELTASRSLGLIVLFCATPVAGVVADFLRAGRSIVVSTLIVLGALFLAYQLNYSPISFYFLSLSLPFATVGSYVVMAQSISPGTRYRTIGLGHAAGSLMMSSTAPVVCMNLWEMSENILYPSVYAAFCIFMGIIGLACLLSGRSSIAQTTLA